jgi:hypothetical protein
MELHLKFIGILLIILSFIHIVFPRYFKWKSEFSSVSLINRQVMYVHTFFIALIVLLMGLLCLVYPLELINTRLGNGIIFGLFIFWNTRMWIQFFGYSSELWRGKKLETFIHTIFSILWIYLSLIFFIIFWQNRTL